MERPIIANLTDVLANYAESKVVEITELQRKQGRRASGRSAKMLTVDVRSGYVKIVDGSGYLDWGSESGRKPGGFPPVREILKWIEAKKITPRTGTKLGFAFAIAKTIANRGTLLYRQGGKSGVLSIPLSLQEAQELQNKVASVATTYVRGQFIEVTK